MSTLGERLSVELGAVTLQKCADAGLANARANLPHIRKTINDLPPDASESALIISAGPSLHRQNAAQRIKQSGYRGALVAADGALGYSLRNGLVPRYVVSVDPHANRIIRWFGDPDLEKREADDYFQRQEMDPQFYEKERKYNGELLALVNQYGPRIRMILATSVSPSVTQRCLQAGMDLYWWNPLYDDYDKPDSYSYRVYELTGVPCMVTGGNVGSAAWVFAQAVLKKRRVGLVGMDLGYPPNHPIEKTQYYKELEELFGEHVNEAFIPIYNPHLQQSWYTDPTYFWYRKVFLEMLDHAHGETYNCTEGGILFGKGIRFVPLADFLSQFDSGS